MADGRTGFVRLLDADGHVRPLADIEIDAIRFAIAHYRGVKTEVARRLRIGRSKLYRNRKDFMAATEPSVEQAPAELRPLSPDALIAVSALVSGIRELQRRGWLDAAALPPDADWLDERLASVEKFLTPGGPQ